MTRATLGKTCGVLFLAPDREIARRVLRTLGAHPSGKFDVMATSSLENALERAGSADAMLLDLGPTDSPGLDSLRALRLAAPETPVVVLATSHSQAREALRLGASDHLFRTVGFDLLLARSIEHVVGQAESRQEVLASEGRLANLFFNSPLAVEEYDEHGTLVRVNDAARDTFGMLEETPDYNLFSSPFLRPGVREALADGLVYRGVIVFTAEHTAIKSSNHEPVWLSATIFPTTDESGRHTGYYAIYEDITEIKAVERDLEERISQEEALTAISALFLTLEPQALEEAVHSALRILASCTGASGAFLCRVHGKGGLFSLAYAWWNVSGARGNARWQNCPTADFPWLFGQLAKHGAAHIDDFATLPAKAAPERAAMQDANLRGVVFAGILKEGLLEGFIGLGAAGRSGPFPESTHSLLLLVGEIVAQAVAKAQSEAEVRRLRLTLMNAREDERARMARAIHDELGARLTGIRYDLAWLARRLTSKRELLAKTKHTAVEVDSIIGAIRRLASDLRPALLDDLGLVAALEWWADGWTESTGIPCQLDLHQDLDGLQTTQASAVFRIVQEALTNAARHAGVPEGVIVASSRQNGALALEITDSGIGFDVEATQAGEGLGLVGMREHAEMAGGRLRVQSSPGTGTRVLLTIPLEQQQ